MDLDSLINNSGLFEFSLALQSIQTIDSGAIINYPNSVICESSWRTLMLKNNVDKR